MTDERSGAPRATYRLQFNKDFTFDQASAIVPYLARLGISHAYASPVLMARPGSTHGYDVVDPTRINPELGGEDGLRRFAATLHEHDLGLIVDIVPNHMGVGGGDNLWWLDVLRNGPDSLFADFFDIDWTPLNRGLHGKILAPFLGEPYGRCLEKGELRLKRHEVHGWLLAYHHHLFPIRHEDARILDSDPVAALMSHDVDIPEGRAALDALLSRQHYQLAWFRTAGDMINWRRFFDVTELATLQADRPLVFQLSHKLILDLYEEGVVDGLRVDHVDGLADPARYCGNLRQALADRQGRRPARRRQRAWLVVEKILGADETLDPSWGVDGTTGYDFMSDVSLVQHDALGVEAIAQHWGARTGHSADFAPIEYEARREIVVRGFTAQLDATVDALRALADRHPDDRDLSRAALRRCLVEILGCFPRYRSYIAQDGADPSATQPLLIAIDAARMRCFPGDREHLERIADWLGRYDPGLSDAALRLRAIRRFEQLSAPVAAKAVEDTAFYRYGPLLSRTDVGFDAGRRGCTIEDWHRAMALRARLYPESMLATATHDHKRGEDVRARLAVLSEQPHRWTAHLDNWLAALDRWLSANNPTQEIEVADRMSMLQTLVGMWPSGLRAEDATQCAAMLERVLAWQMKALREAKLATSWEAPNERYEQAAFDMTHALLTGDDLLETRRDIAKFVGSIASAGLQNGLVQTVLKCCAPGVPDFYQGTEYVDLSLVDPDNRRAVDYDARAQSLDRPDGANARKQAMIAALLALRARHDALFAHGDYTPISLEGAHAAHYLAFARHYRGEALLVLCRRFFTKVGETDACVPIDATSQWSWRSLSGEDAPVVVQEGASVDAILKGEPAAVFVGARIA